MTSAHNMVRVPEGSSFNVPNNKKFVITGTSYSSLSGASHSTVFEGNNEVLTVLRGSSNVQGIPIGYSFSSGEVLKIVSYAGISQSAIILGYTENDV